MKKIGVLLFILLLPSAAFGASLGKNLSVGSTGADVVTLQQFLADQGVYTGPVSGTFGPLTKKAVIAFQVNKGITPASGFVGSITRGIINGLLGASVGSAETIDAPVKKAADVSVKTTFTLPSGAVVDASGTVISQPQNSTVQPVMSDGSVLSASQIVKKLAPSVALITTTTGAGSGVVINGGKYILTNAHVVGTDGTVHIYLPGMSFDAPVLGKNVTTDLAIIYSGDHSPQSATLGSSDESSLGSGDDVFALGYPLSISEGLKNMTLTRGVVSARQKPTWASQTLLQTDAAINHGNSGGPLVNDKGEVIGINTYTDADPLSQTQGIYFAIPIDTAKAWIPALSQNGQSRYEQYPIGSIQTIKKSVQLQIDINPNLSCSTLGFTGSDLVTCNLYRDHKNDYVWNAVDNH